MELGPIWRALMRNKTSYVLIALQIAVTMAIIVNAVGIIQERSRNMQRPSGIDEANTFYISSNVFDSSVDVQTRITADLDAIRKTPGVVDAIMTNSVPLRGGGWSMGLQTEPGDDIEGSGVAVYFVDTHGLNTFDLELVAGRNFLDAEVTWADYSKTDWADTTIMTVAMAESLWPDDEMDDIVGRVAYINNHEPITIVGIVDRIQAPWNGWSGVEKTMLTPWWRPDEYVRYVIRTEPGYRDELMPEIEEMLASMSDRRIIDGLTTMVETRERSYLEDAAMVRMLIFVVCVLTAITSLGIVGLASFSVARRTKQIGTRRALGATRPAILRYFMLENFVISSVGVVSGAVLAVGLNIWMVEQFGLSPIAWYLIPLAMLALWAVGQLAVFGPARRASLVPPALATRAV